MKNSNRYEINYIEGKIIVSKKFLKEAGIIGSTAYTELAQVRRDYPDFPIVQREIAKKQGKQTYGKLDYKAMGEFIKEKEEDAADAVLAEFEHVKALSKIHDGSYAFVKTWFLKRYKDEFVKEEKTEEAVA